MGRTTPPPLVATAIGHRVSQPWPCGGGLLLALSFRWGLLLILNPDTLPPELQQWLRPEAPPPTTTLEELRHELEGQGQTLGEAVTLTTPNGARLLLVPTLDAASRHIMALTLLQPVSSEALADQPERLIVRHTLTLEDWDRDRLLAPLADVVDLAPPPLVPTRLTRLPSPDSLTDGVWFTLEGQWPTPGLTLRYGQILYVDPHQSQLHLLSAWSSPANRLPQWADLEGEGHTDLLVDETLGLEPALRGFRAVSGRDGGIQLVEVTWGQVPLDAGEQAMDYHRVLRLARSGLWQEARDRLTPLKTALAETWNPSAEAQLRTIALHADRSHQQANLDWSLPTQHILALLIDGRWEDALARLEDNPTLLDPLRRRLEVDQGHLWNRIVATISLDDPDPAVFVWGSLALQAQQNSQAAADWLARQPAPASAQQRLRAILTPPPSTPLVTATGNRAVETVTAPRVMPAIAPLTGLIGTAQAIAAPDFSRWYSPATAAIDPLTEAWYTVTVGALHDGQRWRGQLHQGDHAAADLWAAIATDQPTLTLLHWVSVIEARSFSLTLQGIAMNHGQITLLATGPRLDHHSAELPLLAFSPQSLVWLDNTQPQTLGLPDSLIATISAPITRAEMATTLATVPQYQLDLTGNGQPEQVFSLDASILEQIQSLGATVAGTAPKTLIADGQNRLLYSDLDEAQSLVALTNPAYGSSPALLVYQPGGYRLLAWSVEGGRFETMP